MATSTKISTRVLGHPSDRVLGRKIHLNFDMKAVSAVFVSWFSRE